MGNIRYIVINGKQYWHFENTNTIEQAKCIAKYYKKTEKSKYFILKGENTYHLFLTKVRKALT